MAGASPLDPSMWTPENVKDHINARYIAIVGFTLMIWSHVTTLDEEIKHIWKNGAGITLNKALFGVVRYLTTLAFGIVPFRTKLGGQFYKNSAVDEMLILLQGCRGIVISVGAMGFGMIGACDLILLLRTWAICGRTRESLIWLGILLAITHLPTLVLGALWMTTLSIGPSKLYPVILGCLLESPAEEGFWCVILPSVIYNTALSGASMYKIWSYHRTRISTPLISLLIRDGMAYYVIILTAYLCVGFFLSYTRLVAVTIEGRFIISVIAVTCAQLQLNLRTAVYHVPEYVTTYHRQQPVVGGLNGRLNFPHRPGVDTLIFGGTATELERKFRSIEAEVEQEGRQSSHVIELHGLQGTTGEPRTIIAPSAEFGTGEQAYFLPELRRASSFQGSPSHSPWPSPHATLSPHATINEAPPLSPTSNAHSEPLGRSVPRATAPSARTTRTALSFDSNHSWALARPISSPSAAVPPSTIDRDSSPVGIPLYDMSGIPSPRDP